MFRKRSSRIVLVSALAITLPACAADTPRVELAGECAPAFGSELCTWAHAQGEQVVDLGFTIPVAMIENAPSDAAMVWPPEETAVVELPAAAQAASGLDHLAVYWEAHGHPPGPYLQPHFDFHFYGITSEQRRAIDCSDNTKPSALPAGYALPDIELPDPIGMLSGLCVPAMGMHALLASELEGERPFTGTMVVGYYGGETIFIEPMVTREMLLARESFELPIPAIPGGPTNGPTRFRAEYDATEDAYRFTMSGLTGS